MGTILIIIGIALIVMSLLLMIVMPVGGILGVLAGVGAVIYGRKYAKKKKTTEEEFIAQIKAETQRDEFKVAGYDYRQDELAQLLETPNDEYTLSKKSFGEEVIDRAYQFETEWYNARLEDEPENEFDPNAIAVYAKDIKIGYIQRKDQARVNQLRPNAISMEVEIYGGQYKEPTYDTFGEFESIRTGETPYKATLYIRSQ